MDILIGKNWKDYALLDTGDGYRLERFGQFSLVRPDPQIIWSKSLLESIWFEADAKFVKQRDGKEGWEIKKSIPEKWLMQYGDVSFWVKKTPFKHTGVFPEQSVQWDWIKGKINAANRPINILNLFAYTGIATLAAATAGAKVTHVDASKPTLAWAKENQLASNLADKPIRWILDDAVKFCQREVKRGVRYDAIIMDPPIYGHGPGGEKWQFHQSFPQLLKICKELLSDTPLFLLINAYAISSSAIMLNNILSENMKDLGGKIRFGELALQEEKAKRLFSTGIFATWENN